MRVVVSLAGAALAVATLAGCAGRQTDPARAGFFSGLANLTTGTYQQRQAALTQQAVDAEQQRDVERQNLASLQAQRDSLAAERDRLNRNLATLNRRLAAARQDPLTDPARLASVQAEADRINAEAAAMRRANQALAEQQAAARELNSRIDALLAVPVRRE
jgi:chromosome segregation ATPase